jgi:hypothetical protein
MSSGDVAKSEGRHNLASTAAVLAFLGFYWFLSCATLWWAYSVGQEIEGGYFQRSEAITVVAKMGLIATTLTAVAWLSLRLRVKRRSAWRTVWAATWRTAIVMVAYTALVVVRRYLWTPSQGTSGYSMFLPIVGRVNSKFFSEFNWLSFLLVFTPIISVISGCLYYALDRVSKAALPSTTV